MFRAPALHSVIAGMIVLIILGVVVGSIGALVLATP